MNKQDFLKQYQTKEWYETSKRIKARDHNTCQMCGRNDVPLSVHHLYYGHGGDIFDVPDESLITLCEDCHEAQKEYREMQNSLLDDLRSCYTDFELYGLMEYFLIGFVFDGPVYIQKLKPLEILKQRGYGNGEELDNIIKWREQVYGEKLKRQAAIEYLVSSDDKDTIQWFSDTFGYTIDKYLEELKINRPDIYGYILAEAGRRIECKKKSAKDNLPF